MKMLSQDYNGIFFKHKQNTYQLFNVTPIMSYGSNFETITFSVKAYLEGNDASLLITVAAKLTICSTSLVYYTSGDINKVIFEKLCNTIDKDFFNGDIVTRGEVFSHALIEKFNTEKPTGYQAFQNKYSQEVESESVVGILAIPGLSTRILMPCYSDEEFSFCVFSQTLSKAIVHLNDVHHWTREQIADWLDVIHDEKLVDTTIKEKSIV